jgi:hypothetical protein
VLRLPLIKIKTLLASLKTIKHLKVNEASDSAIIITLCDLLDRGLLSNSKDEKLCPIVNFSAFSAVILWFSGEMF